MKTFQTRHEIESAVDDLLRAGVFRPDCFKSPLTRHDVIEIASERTGHAIEAVGDGWFVVISSGTVAAVTLRRIGGVLESVPHAESAKAIVKLIESTIPDSGAFYEAVPSDKAVMALLSNLGCRHDRCEGDFTAMPDFIEPSEMEADLFGVLARTIDCNLNACKLVRRLGISGKRTWFNDKFLPTVPFVLNGRGQPIRLLGFDPDPALHRPQDEGCFIGLEVSSCGTRALIEYRVSEEAVESASFNISSSAKEVVAGEYVETESGVKLQFSLERKNARKLAGVGRVIRRRYPDYVSGQNAYVLLDKASGKAFVDVVDAIDLDGRRRMRGLLEAGFAEAAPAMSM